MIAIKNILVPTDFSPASVQALEYGRQFARQFGARLHLLHTVESVLLAGGAEVPIAAVQQVEESLESSARREMEAAVTADDRATLGALTTIRPAHSAAGDILEYARQQPIDLIVMGTHGRGVLHHLLMGSVAERVVRSAPCPVLTVHTRERDLLRPDALAAAQLSARST